MNTDARISVGLPSHPKTKKLIKRGGQAAAWNLVCLFLWVSQNKPTGDLTGMSDEDIEMAAGWEREEGGLIAMLAEVRFLDGSTAAWKVHDWEVHNPWAAGADRRSEKSRTAARTRWGIATAVQQAPPKDATSMPAACDAHALSNAQVESSNAPPDSSSATPQNGQSPVSVSVSVSDSNILASQAPPPKIRGSRISNAWVLPEDWRADGERARSEAGLPAIDSSVEASKFRDYWLAQAGAKGVKLDWRATWRNWMRNAAAPRTNGGALTSVIDPPFRKAGEWR